MIQVFVFRLADPGEICEIGPLKLGELLFLRWSDRAFEEEHRSREAVHGGVGVLGQCRRGTGTALPVLRAWQMQGFPKVCLPAAVHGARSAVSPTGLCSSSSMSSGDISMRIVE